MADENLHSQLLTEFSHPCLSVLFEKDGNAANGQLCYEMRVFELGSPKHVDISQLVEWCEGCLNKNKGEV